MKERGSENDGTLTLRGCFVIVNFKTVSETKDPVDPIRNEYLGTGIIRINGKTNNMGPR